MIAYGLYGGQAVGFADLDAMTEVGRVSTIGPTVSLEMANDGETALTCAQDQDTCYMLSIPQRSITRTIPVNAGSGPDPLLLLQP
jgi:hypothetical protein